MSALYLPRARRPEALAWVVAVPQVEVAHLRSLDRDDAHHRAGLDRPCVPAADGNDVVVPAPPAVAGLRRRVGWRGGRGGVARGARGGLSCRGCRCGPGREGNL